MKPESSKVIGIVGGMGPQAGIALYESLIGNTQAETDQQHLSVVLIAFPKNIVDRTLFLEGQISTNPGYEIANVIEKLIISGAEVIGIACNTSHSSAIFDIIVSEIEKLDRKIKLLHMPLEVCNYIAENHSTLSRIGLMTTNGTYRSGLYKNMLQARGYEVVVPDAVFQNEVIHKMIYDPQVGIKSNPSCVTLETKSLYREAMLFFKQNNVEAIILGCTELSLILGSREVEGMFVIDSTECLAKALIREAFIDEVAGTTNLTSLRKCINSQ
jgi:aspartate racemase